LNRRQSKDKLWKLQQSMRAKQEANRLLTPEQQKVKQELHDKLRKDRVAKQVKARKNKKKRLTRWRKANANRESKRIPIIHTGILKMLGRSKG